MVINRKIKIALFIPWLDSGGSERQLIELARGLDKSRWDILFITIYEGGGFLEEAKSVSGSRIKTLGKHDFISILARLIDLVRKEKIDILYCSLNTSQVYGLLAKFFLPKLKLVCAVGDAIGPHEFFGFKNAFVNFILKVCENNADLYLFNSQQGRTIKALSVPAARIRVVHNGIDTNKFQPSDLFRKQFRQALGLTDKTVLIACLGYFSIYKDHKTFINAADIVRKNYEDVRFLTIGDHYTSFGKEAISHVKELGIEKYFTFLGNRIDVDQVLPACDIGCSSSITEGFPNCICEFMACAVPCVVTDVGDSRLIVADAGITVNKSDPQALAVGIIHLLQMSHQERTALGEKARKRIVDNYFVKNMVIETEEILKRL